MEVSVRWLDNTKGCHVGRGQRRASLRRTAMATGLRILKTLSSGGMETCPRTGKRQMLRTVEAN